MKYSLIITFLLALLFTCVEDAEAQKRRRGYKYNQRNKSKRYSNYRGGRAGYSSYGGGSKYMTFGLNVNMTNYFGDIAPSNRRISTDFSQYGVNGLGISASKALYPGIFVRGAFNWSRISSSDFSTGSSNSEGDVNEYGRWQRNFHFRNDIKELSLGFEIDFFPGKGGYRGRPLLNPYMFLGGAFFHHAPKAIAPDTDQAGNVLDDAGEWVDLHDAGTEGQNIDSLGISQYSKFQFSIPLGIGLKIKVAQNFDVNFEVGFRYLFTDYVDDIGGDYVDFDAFGDDNLARALSERGSESEALLEGESRSNFGQQSTGIYTHGQNYSPGGNRGGDPNVKDFLITTQIRLVYIMAKKSRRNGKFR